MSNITIYSGLKFIFLLLMSIITSGCISRNIAKAGEIREQFRPKEAYVGCDGNLAIKATATYYRYTLLKNIWIDTSSVFGHYPDDSGTTIPIRRKQVDRYIVISPKWLERGLSTTRLPGKIRIYPIKGITYEAFVDDDKIQFFPKPFLAPDCSISDLPTSFTHPLEIYPLDQPLAISVLGQPVMLILKDLEIKSDRNKPRYWVIPLAMASWAVFDFPGQLALRIISIPAALLSFPSMLAHP